MARFTRSSPAPATWAKVSPVHGSIKGYAIDPWVTDGEARLARVPYSLNGLVSRVCHPIDVEKIKKVDFWRTAPFVPKFLY